MRHIFSLNKISIPFLRTGIFSVMLLLLSWQTMAQDNNFNISQTFPSTLCSPGTYATMRATYYGTAWGGEFRWYNKDTDPIAVFSQYVDAETPYSDKSVYVIEGTSIYVSFYSYATGIESAKKLWTFTFAPPFSMHQEYARECGDGVMRIKFTGNMSAYYTLYRFDAGWNSYIEQQSNNEGYFEIPGFDATYKNDYYIQALPSTGCFYDVYTPVYMDISRPTLTGVVLSGPQCEGSNIEVSAVGTAEYYQWTDNNGNKYNIGDQRKFTIPAGLAAGSYPFSVKGMKWGGGCETAPYNFNVIVNPKPVEGTISASATTIRSGESVTITSTGGIGTPNYWCSNDGGTNWNIFQNAFNGQNSFTHTPPGPGTYRYHVRNSTPTCGYCWDNGGTCTSYVYVDVIVLPGYLQSGTITYSGGGVNYGWAPQAITGTSAGEGICNGNYAYQWQSTTGGANGSYTDIAGATSQNYTPGNLYTTTWFRRVVTCGIETAVSNAVQVNVYAPLQPGTIAPASQLINYGANAAALSVSGVTGGSGSYTYQWQSSGSSTFANAYNIPNATAASYTPQAVTSKTYYRLVVSSNGASAITNVVVVDVHPMLTGGSITPAEYSVIYNNTPGKIAASAAGGGNCSGSYTYQWQQSTDGINYSNIPGATGLSYDPGAIQATTYYRRLVSCGSQSAYSTVSIIKLKVGDENINFVKTREFLKSGINDIGTANFVTNIEEVKQTTQYYDGLGRLSQTVVKQGSKNANGFTDVVAPVLYDIFDRDPVTFLPYVASSSNGFYKINPLKEQADFHKVQNAGEQFYFNKQEVELTELNRPTRTLAPGDNWVGGNHGVETKYYFNTVNDEVRVWEMIETADPNQFGNYFSNSTYQPNQLTKHITTDEQGKQAIEFYDKDGRIIVKKIQLTAVADKGDGCNHTGWLCTYYVYDEGGLLRAVLSPKAVEYLDGNGWTFDGSGTVLNELCFRYKYDKQNRCTMKQIPGAKPVCMVYDKRSRMILTQDGNQRVLGRWLFTKYDDQNRVIMSGFYSNAATLGDLQNFVDNNNFALYETKTSSLPLYTLTNSFPQVSYSDVLTVTYYDDYSWASAYDASFATKDNSLDNGILAINLVNTAAYPFAEGITQSRLTEGLATGTWDRTGNGLLTATYYDDKGRVIQVKHKNYTGGIDFTTNQYNYSGQLLISVQHQQIVGSNPQTHEIWSKVTYDELARVAKTEKKIHSNINGAIIDKDWTVVSQLAYDATGQVVSRKLGNKPGTTNGTNPLAQLAYQYNIRNWLLSVNKEYITSGGSDRYFGMELNYDRHPSNPQFNGNVASQTWKSAGDEQQRKYDYAYDAANRLLKADFTDGKGFDFDVFMGDGINPGSAYDANGNIKAMMHKGIKAGNNAAVIDQLTYKYIHNGNDLTNKLWEVKDVAPATSKLGDFNDKNNNGADDYDYDANGNLLFDKNKMVNSIEYNHLNLPRLIKFKKDDGVTDKGSIEYTYDAGGRKLKKVVVDKSNSAKTVTTTTQYVNGLVYKSCTTLPADANNPDYVDVLQFVPLEEGRIRFEKATQATCPAGADRFVFDYFIKDHLGSTRSVITEDAVTDCYPSLSFDAVDPIELQNSFWEKGDGTPMDVAAVERLWPSSFRAQYGTDPNGRNGIYAVPVSKSTGGIGAGKLLKVMAGDRIHTSIEYYYEAIGANNSHANGLNTLVTSLLGALSGSPAAGVFKGEGVAVSNVLGNNTDVINFFSPQQASNGSNEPPKAYLNILLFDDQFNLDAANSRSIRVGATPNSLGVISQYFNNAISVGKSGYLYVYCSNESDDVVYFDNFRLSQEHGPLLEETHYYPFGLKMAGISSSALNRQENKFKFSDKELQSNEFEDGTGLEWYDFGERLQDPQTGRFFTLDPAAENYRGLSPYTFAGNNPLRFVDIQGMGPGDRIKKAHSLEGRLYSQKKALNQGAELRTGSSDAALEYLDCSEFVCRVLAADGITNGVQQWATGELLKVLSKEDKWVRSENEPKPGDVFLWRTDGDNPEGHTGIVVSYDPKTGIVETSEARGTKYGSLTVERQLSVFTGMKGWRGFYRPKSESGDGKTDATPGAKPTPATPATTAAKTTSGGDKKESLSDKFKRVMSQSGNRIQATKKLLQKALEEAKLDEEKMKAEAEEEEKNSLHQKRMVVEYQK